MLSTFLVLIYMMYGDVMVEAIKIPEGMAACQALVEAKKAEAAVMIPEIQFFGCVQANAGKVA